MKKALGMTVALAMVLMAGSAMAADKVTLQLKWVAQAQFAGYFVAKDKGFYEEAGLDVEIKPGGPDIAPEQVIAGGGADVIVDWMGGALAAREKGVPLVNIAQPYKKAGMELVCPKDGPVQTEADFKGKTLGVWFFGNEYPFFAWMNKLGLSTEGGAGRRDRAQAVLRRAAADPEAGRLHLGHDLQRVLAADRRRLQAGRPRRLQLLGHGQRPAWKTASMSLEDKLADPAFKEKMVKFVTASMKGWEYAIANPDEAAGIVMENGGQDENHQKRMMGEVAKLIGEPDAKLIPAAYERTAKALLDQKIITKEPTGAWTSEITDAMK